LPDRPPGRHLSGTIDMDVTSAQEDRMIRSGQHRRTGLPPARRCFFVLAAGAAAALALLPATRLAAQQRAEPHAGRFRVLVSAPERAAGVPGVAADRFATALADHIDGMTTHAALPARERADAQRRLRLRGDALTCEQALLVAREAGAELVLCGVLAPAAEGLGFVGRFIHVASGEAFDVPARAAGDARALAGATFAAFQTHVDRIRLSTFCAEFLQGQVWSEALGTCTRLAEVDPGSTTALYGIARALLELDSLERSLAVLERTLALDPDHGDALLAAGFVAARLERSDASRAFYRRFLEHSPGSVDVRLRVATEMRNAGDAEGAWRLLEEGLEVAPEELALAEYAGHFALATAQALLERRGDDEGPAAARPFLEAALRRYEQVFDARGAQADATMLRNMLAVLLQLDRAEKAAELGARAVAARDDDAALHLVHADALQRTGRTGEALAALDRVLALDPTLPNVYQRQMVWHVLAGEPARARQSARAAVAAGAASAELLAETAFGQGYNRAGIAALRAAAPTARLRLDSYRESLELFALARELAATPETRAMAAFWAGFIHFEVARRVQAPETAESAAAALPLFERALELFRESGPYARKDARIRPQEHVDAAQQFIDRQQAILRRARR
jgi:tetratricopeptide (TPR) repeat protein